LDITCINLICKCYDSPCVEFVFHKPKRRNWQTVACISSSFILAVNMVLS
jgi:hypothetical protein